MSSCPTFNTSQKTYLSNISSVKTKLENHIFGWRVSYLHFRYFINLWFYEFSCFWCYSIWDAAHSFSRPDLIISCALWYWLVPSICSSWFRLLHVVLSSSINFDGLSLYPCSCHRIGFFFSNPADSSFHFPLQLVDVAKFDSVNPLALPIGLHLYMSLMRAPFFMQLLFLAALKKLKSAFY